MAYGGGLTGLGQLMAAGAGLGKAYQDYQLQQEQQRRSQMMMEEFRQKQAQEKRKNDMMATLGQVYGRLPMAQTPQAGMSPGAAAMAPTDAMPATELPMGGGGRSVSGQPPGGGMSAGGALDQVVPSGGRYDLPGLRQLAINAGFPEGYPANKMAAVSMAESGGRPDAINRQDPGGSYGLTQVNAKAHGDQYARAALKPETAFREALAISKGGTDFKPWTTSKTGADQKFLAQLQEGGGNPRQAQGAALNAVSRVPQQFRGSLQGPDLAKLVDDVMGPGADPATKGMVIEHLIGFADKQTQQEWDQYKFGVQQDEKRGEFRERQEDRRLSRDQMQQYHRDSLDLRRDQGQAGGTVYQPEGGPPMFIDRRGIAKPIQDNQGNPLQTPLTKPGGGGGPRNVPAMIMQQYRKENPQATSADMQRFSGRYAADQAIARSFGGGMAGRNLTALNTVADHVLLAREYAEALQNKDIPRANQVLNRFATETGHPEVKDFNAAKTIMADEIVRLLTSTGGTEQDRKGMQEIFDAMGSPEQLAGTLNVATRMVSGRLKALEQQYARNDPAKREEFQNEMLTDTARKVFGDQMPGASEPQGTPANPGGGGKVIKLDENGNVVE